jgi:hypothetical protein
MHAKNVVLAVALGGLGLLALPQRAEAMVLVPGGAGAPDVFALGVNGTVLNSIAGNYYLSPSVGVQGTAGSNSGTGTYSEWVVKDSGTGTYGAGSLDFVYQVTFSTGDNLEALSMASYAGWATDAGFSALLNGTLSGGTVLPTSESRSSGSGAVMNFNFVPSIGAVGAKTAYLVVETNAPGYTAGSISFQNQFNDSEMGFAPAAPAPAAAWGGLGLFGLLGGAAWRRAKRQTA